MKTFERIKKLLLRQRKKVEGDLEAIKDDDPVMEYGAHESTEPGTDSWMADAHSRVVAVKKNLQYLLDSTKKALDRLRTGKYGKCDKCGHMIEEARLEVIPAATLCISCSKKTSKK